MKQSNYDVIVVGGGPAGVFFAYEMAQKQNIQYESCYQQEIYGPDLATLINKAVDEDSTTKKTYVYRVQLNPAEDEVVEAELVAVL